MSLRKKQTRKDSESNQTEQAETDMISESKNSEGPPQKDTEEAADILGPEAQDWPVLDEWDDKHYVELLRLRFDLYARFVDFDVKRGTNNGWPRITKEFCELFQVRTSESLLKSFLLELRSYLLQLYVEEEDIPPEYERYLTDLSLMPEVQEPVETDFKCNFDIPDEWSIQHDQELLALRLVTYSKVFTDATSKDEVDKLWHCVAEQFNLSQKRRLISSKQAKQLVRRSMIQIRRLLLCGRREDARFKKCADPWIQIVKAEMTLGIFLVICLFFILSVAPGMLMSPEVMDKELVRIYNLYAAVMADESELMESVLTEFNGKFKLSMPMTELAARIQFLKTLPDFAQTVNGDTFVEIWDCLIAPTSHFEFFRGIAPQKNKRSNDQMTESTRGDGSDSEGTVDEETPKEKSGDLTEEMELVLFQLRHVKYKSDFPSSRSKITISMYQRVAYDFNTKYCTAFDLRFFYREMQAIRRRYDTVEKLLAIGKISPRSKEVKQMLKLKHIEDYGVIVHTPDRADDHKNVEKCVLSEPPSTIHESPVSNAVTVEMNAISERLVETPLSIDDQILAEALAIGLHPCSLYTPDTFGTDDTDFPQLRRERFNSENSYAFERPTRQFDYWPTELKVAILRARFELSDDAIHTESDATWWKIADDLRTLFDIDITGDQVFAFVHSLKAEVSTYLQRTSELLPYVPFFKYLGQCISLFTHEYQANVLVQSNQEAAPIIKTADQGKPVHKKQKMDGRGKKPRAVIDEMDTEVFRLRYQKYRRSFEKLRTSVIPKKTFDPLRNEFNKRFNMSQTHESFYQRIYRFKAKYTRELAVFKELDKEAKNTITFQELVDLAKNREKD